jgi:hypothetical protein
MKKWFTLMVAVGLLGFTACSGNSSIKKSAEVKGEGNTSLVIHVPKAAEVKVGDKTDLKISVDRKHFDESVPIKFEDLPAGVSIDGGQSQKIDKGAKEKTFTLTATKEAKEVRDQAVKVTGSFNDGKETRSVSESIALTVKK